MLFEQLNPAAVRIDVTKGEYTTVCSGFKGTTEADVSLAGAPRTFDIKRIDVVGVVTDYCVRITVLDDPEEGSSVRVLNNQVVAVDPEYGKAALAELAATGATTV